MGLPPYLVHQAGAQQETDGVLKTDHVRELNEGTIYRGVGSVVCENSGAGTSPAPLTLLGLRDKNRTGCLTRAVAFCLRGTDGSQGPHREGVRGKTL